MKLKGLFNIMPQSITREHTLNLAHISLSHNRLLSYQGRSWFHYLPKVSMNQSLNLSDGHPPRGTLILDLTSRPRTVEIFRRLDQWILRIAQRFRAKWFPDLENETVDEEVAGLYKSLIYVKDDRTLMRLTFPIWADDGGIEVYNQQRQLMKYPLVALDTLSSISTIIHFQGIWLSDRGFGWNIIPLQILIYDDDELPSGCCLIEDNQVPCLDEWSIEIDSQEHLPESLESLNPHTEPMDVLEEYGGNVGDAEDAIEGNESLDEDAIEVSESLAEDAIEVNESLDEVQVRMRAMIGDVDNEGSPVEDEDENAHVVGEANDIAPQIIQRTRRPQFT